MKALLIFLAYASAGCGAVLYAEPGTLRATDTYVHHGVDLSRAVIEDDYFRYADLVAEQVVRWNSAVADEAMELLGGHTRIIDLRVSVDRNRAAGSVVVARPLPDVLPMALLCEEVAPYLDPEAAGRGILTVVDEVVHGRVTAHTIVFEQPTGRILFVSRAQARGVGSTASLRYFHALTHVARSGARHVSKVIER